MMCEIFRDSSGLVRIRWRCPLCTHRWDFHVAAVEEIGFFVVHHLVNKHEMNTAALLTYDADLAGAIQEYQGVVQ